MPFALLDMLSTNPTDAKLILLVLAANVLQSTVSEWLEKRRAKKVAAKVDAAAASLDEKLEATKVKVDATQKVSMAAAIISKHSVAQNKEIESKVDKVHDQLNGDGIMGALREIVAWQGVHSKDDTQQFKEIKESVQSISQTLKGSLNAEPKGGVVDPAVRDGRTDFDGASRTLEL